MSREVSPVLNDAAGHLRHLSCQDGDQALYYGGSIRLQLLRAALDGQLPCSTRLSLTHTCMDSNLHELALASEETDSRLLWIARSLAAQRPSLTHAQRLLAPH